MVPTTRLQAAELLYNIMVALKELMGMLLESIKGVTAIRQYADVAYIYKEPGAEWLVVLMYG